MSQRRSFARSWTDLVAHLPLWPRRKRGASGSAGGSPADTLAGMAARDFEPLLADAFRLQGYQVSPAGPAGAGGRVDLVLRRDRQTHLVRSNQWRASRVGVDVLNELHAVMTARGAAGGIVVTSGRFSREAVAFAAGGNIRLIDGQALTLMIKKALAARDASAHALS